MREFSEHNTDLTMSAHPDNHDESEQEGSFQDAIFRYTWLSMHGDAYKPSLLRGFRSRLGLTEEEMAERIKVTANSYRSWEAVEEETFPHTRPGRGHLQRLVSLANEAFPRDEKIEKGIKSNLRAYFSSLTKETWDSDRICLLRGVLGLTQIEMARELGVSKNTYQNWEWQQLNPDKREERGHKLGGPTNPMIERIKAFASEKLSDI